MLHVISSSPGELETVFQKILENATRICDAKFAQLFGYADGMFHMLSGQNIPPEMAEFQRQPRVWAPDTAFGRLVTKPFSPRQLLAKIRQYIAD